MFYITRSRNAVQRATRFNVVIRFANNHGDIVRSASASGVHRFAFDHTAVMAQHDRLQLLSTDKISRLSWYKKRWPTLFTDMIHDVSAREKQQTGGAGRVNTRGRALIFAALDFNHRTKTDNRRDAGCCHHYKILNE